MKENKPDKGNPLKQIAVLTGVAAQMGITIYLFVVLGKWLDSKYNEGNKLFLIIFTLLGVGVSLYVVLKQLNKINSK
ncbi:MAG TPA: AtpZ/AtpI family protein [Flavobacteriaceae bacterium]|nr:AtpZ/AtpI family protein [Flavobacteriaceae bacterium]